MGESLSLYPIKSYKSKNCWQTLLWFATLLRFRCSPRVPGLRPGNKTWRSELGAQLSFRLPSNLPVPCPITRVQHLHFSLFSSIFCPDWTDPSDWDCLHSRISTQVCRKSFCLNSLCCFRCESDHEFIMFSQNSSGNTTNGLLHQGLLFCFKDFSLWSF